MRNEGRGTSRYITDSPSSQFPDEPKRTKKRGVRAEVLTGGETAREMYRRQGRATTGVRSRSAGEDK